MRPLRKPREAVMLTRLQIALLQAMLNGALLRRSFRALYVLTPEAALQRTLPLGVGITFLLGWRASRRAASVARCAHASTRC